MDEYSNKLNALRYLSPLQPRNEMFKIFSAAFKAGISKADLQMWNESVKKTPGDPRRTHNDAVRDDRNTIASVFSGGCASDVTEGSLFYLAQEKGWKPEGGRLDLIDGFVIPANISPRLEKVKLEDLKPRDERTYRLDVTPEAVMPKYSELSPRIQRETFIWKLRDDGEGIAFSGTNSNWGHANWCTAPIDDETPSLGFENLCLTDVSGIRVNACDNSVYPKADGKTTSPGHDARCVTDHRYTLVESDDIPKDLKQMFKTDPKKAVELVQPYLKESWRKMVALKLPVVVVTWSGGKSLHAICRIDAGQDAELFEKRVRKMQKVCRDCGYNIDSTSDPCRYTRLAGSKRMETGVIQSLVWVSGCCPPDQSPFLPNWKEWEDFSDTLRIVPKSTEASKEVAEDNTSAPAAPAADPLDRFTLQAQALKEAEIKETAFFNKVPLVEYSEVEKIEIPPFAEAQGVEEFQVPDFDLDLLPDSIYSDFAKGVSDQTGCSAAAAALDSVAAVACAMRGRVRVRLGPNHFRPACIGMIVVGSAATRKGASMGFAKRPLDKHDSTQRQEADGEMVTFQTRIKKLKKTVNSLSRKKGKDEDEEKKIDSELQAAEMELLDAERSRPTSHSLTTSNATPEAMIACLRENDGYFNSVDEDAMGVMGNVTGKYSGTADVEIFLKGLNGEKIDRRRRGSGGVPGDNFFILSPTVNLWWKVQPEFFREFTGNRTVAASGFLRRVLFIDINDYKLRQSWNYGQTSISDAVINRYNDAIRRVLSFSGDVTFKFSEKCQAEFNRLFTNDQHLQVKEESEGRGVYGSWVATRPEHIAKVAAVMQVAKLSARESRNNEVGVKCSHLDNLLHSTMEICRDTFKAAIEIVNEYFTPHAYKSLANAGTGDEIKDIESLKDYIKGPSKGMTVIETESGRLAYFTAGVLKNRRRGIGDINRTLSNGCDMGLIQHVKLRNVAVKKTRTVDAYFVNTSAFEGWL